MRLLLWSGLDISFSSTPWLSNNSEAATKNSLLWMTGMMLQVLHLVSFISVILCSRLCLSYLHDCCARTSQFSVFVMPIANYGRMCSSWTAPCDGHCRCRRCGHEFATVDFGASFGKLGCNTRDDHSTLHSTTFTRSL